MADEVPPSSHAITALRLVAIPSDESAETIAVTAIAEFETVIESIAVASAHGLWIETSAKPGVRQAPLGAITSDLRLEDAAAGVVTSALLEQIPPDAPRESMRSRVEAVMEEGRLLGDQVWKPAVWKTQTVTIDGETFVLFVTALTGAFAAVADIGASRVTIYGPHIADDITLRLVPISALPGVATD